MQEKLETLYKQMELELHHLKPIEKQRVKAYMMWAFDRGESSILDRIKNR